MLAVHLVTRHQMERGFATRPLQPGPMLNGKGAAGAARSIGMCTKGLRWRKQASNMLAVRLGALLLVLGQAVGDLVIVAFVGHKDVVAKLCAGWLIKCAHGNGDLVTCDGVPKQEGATLPTKAAPYLLAGGIPSEFVVARDRQSRLRHVGGGPIMAALFAALGAMASIRLGKVALHRETDLTAKA
jgi:hypothetical protein